MNAYLSLCPYYMLAPELELNHGYCDFFLLPDHWRFPMVQHSYILELKYLKTDATPSEADSQWQQATSQILSSAQSPSVRQMLANTRLHTIVMQFRGYDLERLEEIG